MSLVHPDTRHGSSMVKAGERAAALGLTVLGFAALFIMFGPEALAFTAVVFMVSSARRRVEVKGRRPTALWLHSGIFLVVNIYLVGRDLVAGDGLGFALWVLLVWGVVLAIHASSVVWAMGVVEPTATVEGTRSRDRLRL